MLHITCDRAILGCVDDSGAVDYGRRTTTKLVGRNRWVIASIVGVIAFALLIMLGYWLNWTWTGLPNQPDISGQPSGTPESLWDWLDLLIVPLVLAGGGLLFSKADRENDRRMADIRSQEDASRLEERAQQEAARDEARAKLERELEDDRLKESALQTYMDRMSDLVSDIARNSTSNSPTARQSTDNSAIIIRARTLSLLTRLDGTRKGFVLSFLSEAGLIASEGERPLVSLEAADLSNLVLTSGSYSKCDLSHCNLRHADLGYISMEGAILYGSDIFKARFEEVSFHGANLQSTTSGRESEDASFCRRHTYRVRL